MYVLEIIRVRKDLILMLCLFIVEVHLALSAPHFDNLKETSNRLEHDYMEAKSSLLYKSNRIGLRYYQNKSRGQSERDMYTVHTN